MYNIHKWCTYLFKKHCLQLNSHVLVIKYISRLTVLPQKDSFIEELNANSYVRYFKVSSGKFSMQISEAIYFPRIVIVSLEPILESIFFVIIKY